MVGLGGVGGNHYEDATNDEEVVYDSPPGIGWEAVSGLDLSDDGSDEGYYPCQLSRRQHKLLSKNGVWGRKKSAEGCMALEARGLERMRMRRTRLRACPAVDTYR